ncbi:hypothetical protein LWI29_033638 [Acer saccharum]|uniref:non-specific serine/threonine protein kinase n=1 Tax=Acer saccharum TaxID=4024 RepID=A0AA39VZ26_ACESA|nr:hypothetical protein LWI29_033638 [Acer saccharum]
MIFQLLWLLPFVFLQCFTSVVLLNIRPSLAIILSDPERYHSCSIPFNCGNISAGYPFWGDNRPQSCGHPDFGLRCENPMTTIVLNQVSYYVKDIDVEAHVLKIASKDLYYGGFCYSDQLQSHPHINITEIDSELFQYVTGYRNLTVLYGCPFSATHPGYLNCTQGYMSSSHSNVFIQTGDYGSERCNYSVTVPVAKNTTLVADALQEAIYEGFELKWDLSSKACEDCRNSNGSCGYDGQLVCYCPNLPYDLSGSVCASSSLPIIQSPASTGSTARVLVVILIIISSLLISGLLRKLIAWNHDYSKKKRDNDQNMEAIVNTFGSLVLQRFDYSYVKKITKSFSTKLGQGGYGDVYKGKLPDGRLVAVKVLKESKGNGEEFINEVASICRTSHVNVVALLGFCYNKNKRALIYDFMSNGSLDKYIFDKESSNTKCNLEWKTKYQIAIGIARGLEYLHRGCNTRIVHFDIKPHNILLDEDFCPKISDFGLAKLCKNKESIISMLGARGTVGYIAPEVFCRSFGEVSHKSDVYSYGMMILEMVGGRNNIVACESHTSEIYFPNWIYKQLEPGRDFEISGAIAEEEKEVAKKMIIVSMWCIQTIPSDRPSMSKVVEMLEGSLESLEIPPKPSLSLPTRSPKHSIPSSSLSTSKSAQIPASQGEICIELSDM